MKRSLLCLGLISLSLPAWAEVRLPGIFGDHMVLQQGASLPVWGTADPGEKVTVTIGGRTASATADASGKWNVRLEPLPPDGQGLKLEVKGSNELVFNDVVVGEVWLCSGQSNMAWTVQDSNDAAEAIAQAKLPAIRLFTVGKRISWEPETEQGGRWVVCSPETVKRFSAVGYFFGREIEAARKAPVGLIGSYWGATPAEAWTSLEALKANPALAHYASGFEKTKADREVLRKKYYEEILPKHNEAVAVWKKEHEEPFKQRLADWEKEAAAARAEGKPVPKKPELKVMAPRPPRSVDGNPRHPSVLFNGMINAIIPYAIRGVIWYQGEGNAGTPESAALYETLFPAMVADWRGRWGQGDFPFLYVQLAAFGRGKFFPELREAQRRSLAMPNSAMAVAIDIGDRNDIHPRNKREVGRRLALLARREVYGERELIATGPVATAAKADGAKVRVEFAATGNVDTDLQIREGGPSGFEIAGEDGFFRPAFARVEGNCVVLESASVRVPKKIRYAWAPYPDAALFNQEGLPAAPFALDVR